MEIFELIWVVFEVACSAVGGWVIGGWVMRKFFAPPIVRRTARKEFKKVVAETERQLERPLSVLELEMMQARWDLEVEKFIAKECK